MSKKNQKEVAAERVEQKQEQESTPASISPALISTDQLLTDDDIINSCGSPIEWEVPELPRNGKPGIVFIKQPSFEAMNSFWSRQDEDKGEKGEEDSKPRNRADEACALIRFLFVKEDGTPLFRDDQISYIKKARFDVFQRLQEGVNSVVQPIIKGISKETPNPFGVKEETK